MSYFVSLVSALLLSVLPLAAIAGELPAPAFMKEHSELFSWFLGIAIVVIGFLLAYYINRADKNNQAQWDKLNNHETRLTTVETEHNVLKKFHCHHRATDDV